MTSTIKDIDSFLAEHKLLEKTYSRAQEKLLIEKVTDNELYLECLKYTNNIIKYLDELNPFVMNRHKDEIKGTYYISAELLVRTVGLNMSRQNFNDQERNTLYMAIAHVRKVLSIEPFHSGGMELFKMVFLFQMFKKTLYF